MTIDYARLLDSAEKIARNAGAAIYRIYGLEFSVVAKEDQSPLTEADSAAHFIIKEGLLQLTPEIPILSEEDVKSFAGPNSDGRYWLVDPLDGTKEFIRRNGEFTVNIALIEQGQPVLGVVFAPVLNISYLAARGMGAFERSAQLDPQPIRTQGRMAGKALRIVGSRSHAGDSLTHFLKQVGNHELVSMGSSLKFCLVAEGRAELYPRFGPTSLWDTAAAQCVIEQAGGSVVQLDGTPLSYANPAATLNPFFIAHSGDEHAAVRLAAELV